MNSYLFANRQSILPRFLMDYLCIGHVCQDIVEDGYALGGSASYCSLAAHHLGKKAGVLTSFGDDFSFRSAFDDIAFHNKLADSTTIFSNVYQGMDRTQYLYKRASNILVSDLPNAWKNVPLVHIGPIADEVDFALIKAFSPNTIIAATPQGWIRQWDEETRVVSPKVLDWNKLLGIDILILSDEDILGYEDLFPTIVAQTELVVLTRGDKPATVFYKKEQQDFPVFPVVSVDPTGAGDTFATGFLVKYLATKDISKAMAYGHVVASFCIENKGLEGLKNLENVEKRYLEYLKQYGQE